MFRFYGRNGDGSKMNIKYSSKDNESKINSDLHSFSNPNMDSSLYDTKDLSR